MNKDLIKRGYQIYGVNGGTVPAFGTATVAQFLPESDNPITINSIPFVPVQTSKKPKLRVPNKKKKKDYAYAKFEKRS